MRDVDLQRRPSPQFPNILPELIHEKDPPHENILLKPTFQAKKAFACRLIVAAACEIGSEAVGRTQSRLFKIYDTVVCTAAFLATNYVESLIYIYEIYIRKKEIYI